MSTSQFADRAPEVSQLTAYDESHLTVYLRLLDADEGGADWREAAQQWADYLDLLKQKVLDRYSDQFAGNSD